MASILYRHMILDKIQQILLVLHAIIEHNYFYYILFSFSSQQCIFLHLTFIIAIINKKKPFGNFSPCCLGTFRMIKWSQYKWNKNDDNES